MTKEDLDSLAEVVKLDPEMDSQFVYSKLALGEMLPWRIETDKGNTILVAEVKQKKQSKVLYVWYLSGKGLIGHAKYVMDTLVEYAKLHDCVAIEALMHDMRLAKYFGRGNFDIKHVFVRKEIH
jgi:hypothetical protein